MTTIKTQIRTVFRKHGIETKPIEYNTDTDWYITCIKNEGTSTDYRSRIEGTQDYTLDFHTVRDEVHGIDGTEIPSGEINIVETDSNCFKIRIE